MLLASAVEDQKNQHIQLVKNLGIDPEKARDYVAFATSTEACRFRPPADSPYITLQISPKPAYLLIGEGSEMNIPSFANENTNPNEILQQLFGHIRDVTFDYSF